MSGRRSAASQASDGSLQLWRIALEQRNLAPALQGLGALRARPPRPLANAPVGFAHLSTNRLGELLERRALARIVGIHRLRPDLCFHINKSGIELATEGFARRFCDSLRAIGIAPQAVAIEMTETAILADEGATLSGVIDDIRRDQALARLSNGREPVASISAELGYSDQSCLTRAMRRWTNAPPSRIRRG